MSFAPQNEPRAASVTATSAAVTCYAVDKETFDELLGNLKGIMEMTHRDRMATAEQNKRGSSSKRGSMLSNNIPPPLRTDVSLGDLQARAFFLGLHYY